MKRVAIIGVGYTIPTPKSSDFSYKELEYKAATKAYNDANLRPSDIGSFVSVLEDLNEGTSIADEYTPDQIGAVLRPMSTVCGDGIHAIGDAFMRIQSGISDTVMISSHSKASNILSHNHILSYALDPVYNRPLGLNPHFIAGLEMNRFLHETGITQEQAALVVCKNKENALLNDLASYGGRVTIEDVMQSGYEFYPLKKLEISRFSDAGICMILASEDKVKSIKPRNKPIWIKGIGWANDTPTLESRDWVIAAYVKKAAELAYRMARITNPCREIDLFELDDTYSYKELQHLISLGIYKDGDLSKALVKCETSRDGKVVVNASGGSLGFGNLLDATGLLRAVHIVLQLRRQAGRAQLDRRLKVGLAQSWRGIPTTSGAVVILSV